MKGRFFFLGGSIIFQSKRTEVLRGRKEKQKAILKNPRVKKKMKMVAKVMEIMKTGIPQPI